MRAGDFRFNLHRRGMKQDTVYTTEVDAEYMHAVELLKKRRYEEALTILRPYEDRNTALAYMSLGYDAAAYRILRAELSRLVVVVVGRRTDGRTDGTDVRRSADGRTSVRTVRTVDFRPSTYGTGTGTGTYVPYVPTYVRYRYVRTVRT